MWCSDLAKEIKNRDNEFKIGATIGGVLSITPLSVGILNNKVIVNENNSKVSSRIYDLIRAERLSIGDLVMVITSENNGLFFVVDKLGGA